MGRRFLLVGLWIVALAVTSPGALALAADAEGADLEAVIQELRAENPDLSESEARELAGLAVKDLREGEGAAERDLTAGAGWTGPAVLGSDGLGMPDLGGGAVGGGPGYEMTPEEKALAEKVGARAEQLKGEGLSEKEIDATLRSEFEKEFGQFGEHEWAGERDDARLRELYEKGVPGIERGEFSGERPTPEQMERYREQMEHGGREFERPAYEREQPTAEQPTRETESPPYEEETPRY